MWRLLLRIRNFLPSPAGTLNLCFPISILFEIFNLFRNIGTEKHLCSYRIKEIQPPDNGMFLLTTQRA